MVEAVVETTVTETVKDQVQSVKVQNKISDFIERSTSFYSTREEFVQLNKKYRELPKEDK